MRSAKVKDDCYLDVLNGKEVFVEEDKARDVVIVAIVCSGYLLMWMKVRLNSERYVLVSVCVVK